MSIRWYGSINNRLEENKMFCDEIKVGTGVTEYSWSDRHAYEVIAVKDQKHVTIREYDAKHIGAAFENKWELVSNENNATYDMVKRGKYWYSMNVCTPELAKQILENGDIHEKMWLCNNGFDAQEIIASGKAKTKYHRWNISFGVADYHYDYEF